MKALCITLDPGNELRATRALREIKKLGFDVNPIKGVDGSKLTSSQIKQLLSPRAFYELQNGRYVHEALSSPGAIGCYLAHVRAWKHVVKENTIYAIFEDDFVAKKNAKENLVLGLKDLEKISFDICRLQHRSNPDIGEEIFPIPGTTLVKVKRTEGLTAYIITPEAAKKLLSRAFPIDSQVDHYLDFSSYHHGLRNLALKEDTYADPQVPSLIQHNNLIQYPPCRNKYIFGSIFLLIFILFILWRN